MLDVAFQEFDECLLYGVNAACAPGACHNDIGANSSNRGVRCGAEVTYAIRNGTGKIAEFPQEEATP